MRLQKRQIIRVEKIAGGTTNGGAGDQTVGSATTDTANKPVNGGTDKPEGIVVK